MQRIDIGLYLVTSIGLSSFVIGHTLATFQAVGKMFLLIQLLIILTIGKMISCRHHPLNSRFVF